MKYLLTIASAIMLLSSCEDVIEIDLESIEPKLVIEGIIDDSGESCQVKLSKTTDYFHPGIYPAVEDAQVSINDNQGNEYAFSEIEPGLYSSKEIRGIEHLTYTLNVFAEEQNYEARVSMPGKVNIDFLSNMIPPAIFEFDEGYMVNCHFQDPAEEINYYRMKAWLISDETKAENSKVVFNDQFQNGIQIIAQWDIEPFMPFDTVVVELQTLDKSTYDYYYTLFPIMGDAFMGASNPSNPDSNLSNDALGFFGSCTISRDTIVIMPVEG